jgi:hypothetical protein
VRFICVERGVADQKERDTILPSGCCNLFRSFLIRGELLILSLPLAFEPS